MVTIVVMIVVTIVVTVMVTKMVTTMIIHDFFIYCPNFAISDDY